MLDQGIGLVGREETIELVELLVRSRPLPILVAFGPGGSGKSALLSHVERRYRDWPVSRVNLDGMGSTDCNEVLAAIVDDLQKYTHPEFGTFRLPRYRLARLAMASAAEATGVDGSKTLARNLLAVRLTKLPKVPQALAAAADLMPAIMGSGLRIIQPALAFAASFGVSAPRWLRPLLVGPRMASAFSWYETVAPRDDLLALARPTKASAAVVALWRHLARRDPASQRHVDRLLVAAFLADLDAVCRRRHRRKVTCIVLLDGVDMLEPFTDSLFAPNGCEEAAPANNFLELFAEARLTMPDAPLLVIATKQARADRPSGSGSTPPDPVPARANYGAWLSRFRHERTARNVYLSVPLLAFTLPQTAQFLAEWSRTQDYPIAQPTLVRELHQVTRGHPLAVELAVRATGLRFRANNARPAVRDAFGRRLPEGQHTAEPDMTIGDYVLFRFLQRFRGGDDIAERQRTQELLARLASARRIDVTTVGLLAPERDPQDVLDRLRKYSFTETDEMDGQECLTLHPLLCDLLAQRLQIAPGGSYRAVHYKLRNYYRAVSDRTEELYHCLALDEVEFVSRELRDRARRSDDPTWPAMLDSVAEAPLAEDERRLTRRVRRVRAAAVKAITPRPRPCAIWCWRLGNCVRSPVWNRPCPGRSTGSPTPTNRSAGG